MTERPLDDDLPATKGMLKELATKRMLEELATKVELKAAIAALEGRLNETAVETRRHFDVVAEGLRDDMRLLADGITANTVAVQRLTTQVQAVNECSTLTELRVDDHERRIRSLETSSGA